MPASKVRLFLFLSSVVETIIAFDLLVTGGLFIFAYYLLQESPSSTILHDQVLQFLPVSVRTSRVLVVMGGFCIIRALLMLLVGHLGRKWARGKGSPVFLYQTSFINLVIDLLLIFGLGVQGHLGNNSFWFSIVGLLVATFIFWCAGIERERAHLAEDLS